MKVVLAAGGLGTRLSDKEAKPKPMVEIGGMPIIWHIMKYTVIMELMNLLFV